jgi:hypothetical protein
LRDVVALDERPQDRAIGVLVEHGVEHYVRDMVPGAEARLKLVTSLRT